MSAAIVGTSVLVLWAAPGRGVPQDLVETSRERLERELGESAIADAVPALRRIDRQTKTQARLEGERARARRLRGEFPEDAMTAQAKALDAADEGFIALTDPRVLAALHAELGQMKLDAGEAADARAHFSAAFRIDPGFRADPAHFSPAARRAMDEVAPPACAHIDEERARRAGEALGAARVVVVRSCAEGGRVRLRLVELTAERSRREKSAVVAMGLGLDRPTARRLLGLPKIQRHDPWYRRGWVWVVAGAVAVAAVAVPIATAQETGDVRVHW
jgi:hypothetical protein